jgi:hypothetical protein
MFGPEIRTIGPHDGARNRVKCDPGEEHGIAKRSEYGPGQYGKQVNPAFPSITERQKKGVRTDEFNRFIMSALTAEDIPEGNKRKGTHNHGHNNRRPSPTRLACPEISSCLNAGPYRQSGKHGWRCEVLWMRKT